MEDEVQISCTSSHSEEVPMEIQHRTGFSFPEAHFDSAALAGLSKAMKKLRKEMFCRLPFCLTVEAEALGADIHPGDMKTGPRIRDYVYQKSEELQAIDPIRFDHGRIKTVLDAARILRNRGETVALTIEGPITILSSLIAPEIVYKGLLKKDNLITAALIHMASSVVSYGQQALLNGVQILSYADPLGNIDIIGPNLYQKQSGLLTHAILQQLTNSGTPVIIHLCGKASRALEKMGYCKAEQMAGNNKTSAEQLLGLMNDNGQPRIIGHRCFRRVLGKKSRIWMINLTDPYSKYLHHN